MAKFPWTARAKEVEEAQLASKAETPAAEQGDRFYRAILAAYPPDFWDHYEWLKAGDTRGVEMAIEFLEADPWFFRSGYIKARIARFLKRVDLSKQQRRRLEMVVLRIVDERNTEEFRDYCRLARVIATPMLIDALHQRQTAENIHRRLRATWMLATIEQPGQPPKHMKK